MTMLAHNNESLVMGILNVTPDSFSDGGHYFSVEMAAQRASQMVSEGADIIDVGGESSRPGSEPVRIDEELKRVIPVIETIRKSLSVPVSIDTTKPEVADAALSAGASIINDVSMLRYGTPLAQVAAKHDATLILMHSRGTPKNMHNASEYTDIAVEVRNELLAAVSKAMHVGVSSENIWLDPGIGFAKTAEQSMELIARLKVLVDSGYPVLSGPSRKSFIGHFTGTEIDNRLGGTAAAVAISIYNGAAAVRVHDIGVMKQVAAISSRLRAAMGNQ
ncbi:MAG: dihydropteroate synthase [Deltaproteobacteria bacterium]|nr:dihydropteroate synthase [Deltaproteobacteria bacterium]